MDLTDRDARQALLADIDASARRILVVTEGIVPYLANDEVEALGAELRGCANVEGWVTEALGSQTMRLRRLLLGRRPELARAPIRFHPRDWSEFFARLGWTPRHVRHLALEAERLRRPLPLPGWMRLLVAILPRSLRRHYGWALLVRS